jgi:hypothetical protein
MVADRVRRGRGKGVADEDASPCSHPVICMEDMATFVAAA